MARFACNRPTRAGPTARCFQIPCAWAPRTYLIEASVSLRTHETYKGTLTGTLLYCAGNPGIDLPPRCSAPTSNKVSHLGMIAFRFDAPNGGVGPSTRVTFQALTSTDGIALNRCVPVRASPYTVFSDANTLRITDSSGRHLYITIRTSGTACGTCQVQQAARSMPARPHVPEQVPRHLAHLDLLAAFGDAVAAVVAVDVLEGLVA
jgi:hypothetical protein